MLAMTMSMLAALSCTPIPDIPCTRNIQPVCVDGVQYSNECMARAAGYYGQCAKVVVPGSCRNTRDMPILPTGLLCHPDEVYSEVGRCVKKPWSYFLSCAEEVRQGACSHGDNPNPWVAEHCAITCARSGRS